METVEKPKDNRPLAIVMVQIFTLGMTIISSGFKLLAREGVSNFDFAVYRAGVGLILMASYMCYLRCNPFVELPRRHYVKMVVRSLLGTWGFILFYYCIQLIPITLHMVVFQTSPVWTSIVAVLFLKEKLMKFEYVAMVLSFGGVIFVAFASTGAMTNADSSSQQTVLGICLAFVMAWFVTFINLFNRMMSDVPWHVVMFCHSLLGFITPTVIVSVEAMIVGDFRIITYTWR